MSKVILPGSFDPFTKGHLDLAQRAMKLFDQVIIVVLANSEKNTLFTLSERQALIESLALDPKKVVVCSFNGLLVDFCQKQDCFLLLKGIRNQADYVYEKKMARINQMLDQRVETIFLPSHPLYQELSSTLVKSLAQSQADLSNFLPQEIGQKLREKITDGGRNES